jgi:hypothetical protein
MGSCGAEIVKEFGCLYHEDWVVDTNQHSDHICDYLKYKGQRIALPADRDYLGDKKAQRRALLHGPEILMDAILFCPYCGMDFTPGRPKENELLMNAKNTSGHYFTRDEIIKMSIVISSLPLCDATREFYSDVPIYGCKEIGTRTDRYSVFCDKHSEDKKVLEELPYAKAVRSLLAAGRWA